MENVTVVFTNGNIVNFLAEEFAAEGLDGNQSANVKKYAYKDAQGKDSFVFLTPSQIAGVFLTKAAPGDSQAVSYKVGGSQSS